MSEEEVWVNQCGLNSFQLNIRLIIFLLLTPVWLPIVIVLFLFYTMEFIVLEPLFQFRNRNIVLFCPSCKSMNVNIQQGMADSLDDEIIMKCEECEKEWEE